MKFGNWQITDATLEWSGQGLHRFVITKQSLLEVVNVSNVSGELYNWIVLATEEEWLTHDELYDLNFAFVYAAGTLEQFDYEIFDRTVEYQFDLLDEEEETEPE